MAMTLSGGDLSKVGIRDDEDNNPGYAFWINIGTEVDPRD